VISQASKKMIEQIKSNLASLQISRGGIAVSGGSDSMALLHILSDWESATKPKLLVASIDHGLRPESKSEVEFVKKICEEKKVEHVSSQIFFTNSTSDLLSGLNP
jgi:tRNA(Ile)-lysidine synthase